MIDCTGRPPGFVYLKMQEPGRRARLAEHFIVVRDDEEALDTLINTDADLLRWIALFPDDAAAAEAFLGEESAQQPPVDATEPGSVEIVADHGDGLSVRVEAQRPALLFLADNWYPNFRATVDGRPAPIWRANFAYRATPVPEGSHLVEFVYRPVEFYAGLATTGLGLVLLILAARLRQRGRAPGPARQAVSG